jgi:hypothetical protein
MKPTLVFIPIIGIFLAIPVFYQDDTPFDNWVFYVASALWQSGWVTLLLIFLGIIQL